MQKFFLTRADAAQLLIALEQGMPDKLSDVMHRAWAARSPSKRHGEHHVLSEPLPSIAMKLMKSGGRRGLSLHEIAELGQLVEFANPSSTSMQNWVKRDFKSFFVCPQAGKKYSPGQAALLYMIDDMKSSLDFDSLRGLFGILFGKTEGGQAAASIERSKPIITPIALYACYAELYEEIKSLGRQGARSGGQLEEAVRIRADKTAAQLSLGTELEREALRNMLLVSVISVHTSYCQALARRYSEATVFLEL